MASRRSRYSFQPGTQRGVVAFADFTLNDKRTSLEESYVDAGILLEGPPGRPNDTFGIGWIKNNVNNRAIDEHEEELLKTEGPGISLYPAEQVVEADYSWQVIPWLSVHPTVQYWIDPGAVSFKRYKNAWLLGTETTILF